MAHDAVQRLEFDRVLERLAARCQYSVAAERAVAIGPSGDHAQVEYLLSVTREAVDLLTENPGFSVGGVRDIRKILGRASKGVLLLPAELRETLDTIQAARAVRRNFYRLNSPAVGYPSLSEFVDAIADLAALEADLARTVGPRGEILDTASTKLSEIRADLKTAHGRLLDQLNRMVAQGAQRGVLQDPIVTMREGRYVIPVRADRRGDVPGVVHGTSASGQTLFVEPMPAVDLNNRWRELQMAEEHEVEWILRDRTDQVGAIAGDLERTVDAVAALDLAFAKARLAFDLRATEPQLVELDKTDAGGVHPRKRINLREARHPLLNPATVVPIDVRLGDEYRVLVITGPNTGGKTVALKTIGLLTLMAQSGLFIPAADGAELSVFDAVFPDIGDEQSIEQSLSTFSGHMTRIIAMLQQADAESLVLLDEIAAGTDPQEGSALARAIIRALLERGCLAVVTTHYSELKAFAYVTEGTENASVEFDDRTLQPTFRLTIGVPGRSNALTIARRLGLPDAIIQDARSYLQPGAERAEDLLAEIQRRRAATEALLHEARRERETATRARESADEALRVAERAKAEARKEALADLAAELKEARGLIRRIQRRAAEPATSAPDAGQARDELRQAEQQVREVARRPQVAAPPQALQVGDTVEVRSLGMEGEIAGFSDDGEEADVQVGAFKVRQPIASLRRTGSAKPRPVTTQVKLPPAPTVDQEIHLRGMRAAQIEEALDPYLDAAARASLPWVRIVHGKGSGTLRSIVHDVLRRHPVVDRFELAESSAGGEGVTIAYLKD